MLKCDFNKAKLSNFIEITLWHGCSSLTLLDIFRTLFPRNTSGWLLLYILWKSKEGSCRSNILQVLLLSPKRKNLTNPQK